MPFTGRYGILLVGVVDKRQAVCSPFESGGASFCLPIVQKGGLTMVTYSDLIQTGILVVGIIGLFIQILKK